jgi:hypothetical protein
VGGGVEGAWGATRGPRVSRREGGNLFPPPYRELPVGLRPPAPPRPGPRTPPSDRE